MDSILTGLGFSTEKQKSFKNKLYSWRTRTAKRTEILQNSDATEADHRWLSKDFLHSYGTTFWSTKYTEAGIISDEDEEALMGPLASIWRAVRKLDEEKANGLGRKRGRKSGGSQRSETVTRESSYGGDDASLMLDRTQDESPVEQSKITIKLPFGRLRNVDNVEVMDDREPESKEDTENDGRHDNANDRKVLDFSPAYWAQGHEHNNYQEGVRLTAQMWITVDRAFGQEGNFFKRVILDEQENVFREILNKLPINRLQKRCVTDLAIKFGWSNESHRLSRDVRETWIQLQSRMEEAWKNGETKFEMWVLVLRDIRKEVEARTHPQLLAEEAGGD